MAGRHGLRIFSAAPSGLPLAVRRAERCVPVLIDPGTASPGNGYPPGRITRSPVAPGQYGRKLS